MKTSTILVYEDTKRKLEEKKTHPRESYDAVLKRMLENENIPTLEEMFRYGDTLKQKKVYTSQEIIKLSHALRDKK